MGIRKVFRALGYGKKDKKWQLKEAFMRNFHEKSSLLADGRFDCDIDDIIPCLSDATETTSFDYHYVYHAAWAARMLADIKPTEHVDISSTVYFNSIVSAFIPIKFYDYRPAPLTLSNLECAAEDLLKLSFADNSIDSISCMHVVEHVGLERYGDAFNPKGDLIAISELIRVVSVGGYLLFVVPLGCKARIQYNAHRIYTYQQVLHYFEGLQLVNFSFITDQGDFIFNATEQNTHGQMYGCGCFLFQK